MLAQEFDPDVLASKMLKSDRPRLAGRLMGAMDTEGRQAAKYAMVQRAAEKALDQNLESGLSNAAFLRTMNTGGTRNAVFTGNELRRLADVEDIVRATRRASGHAADPKTGARTIPYLVGGIAGPIGYSFGGPLGAVAALGGAGLAANATSRALMSPAVQGLLMSSPELLLGPVGQTLLPIGQRAAGSIGASLMQRGLL
ncbi:MAG: hypothetical protein IT531_15265 [Burkholderiales bacterium]|nr:hypothetical protein [Burkholderiales bacterium]